MASLQHPTPYRPTAISFHNTVCNPLMKTGVSSSVELVRHLWTKRKSATTGDIVWSDHIEAALLDGLAQYEPTLCRETVMLRRYPKRNRFVSEYIWKRTGERRSAKQVGSRIQQLREICHLNEDLESLLFPPLPRHAEAAHCVFSDPDPIVASGGGDPVRIIINVLPQTRTAPNDGRRLTAQTRYSPPLSYELSGSQGDARGVAVPHPGCVADVPRPIHIIDPTITFWSRVALPETAQAEYSVYSTTTAGLVHTECTRLTRVSVHIPHGAASFCPNMATTDLECEAIPPPPPYLYSTPLVPLFWETITRSIDPTQYQIVQHVLRSPGDSVFCAIYTFQDSF
ncbi:hypothetical protein C8F01DRAFT_218537 [Mycena amicta]|nr:hypothetical protein C8F01DRAFT_218537 [Mycena amicta]